MTRSGNWAAILLSMMVAAAGQDLQSAMHKEMVAGDLSGAIAEYRAFLASPNAKNRSSAATALLHLAECQEKLGDRNSAQRTYMRLSRNYTDQPAAAEARDKLFHWMEPPGGPRNLAFEKGEPGKLPPGWFSHSAEWSRAGCRSATCAVVAGSEDASDADAGAIRQTFSAAAYRGQTVRLRAWLRLESSDPLDRAQMWLRVERSSRQTGFFDNMADRPVRSSSWTLCEISGDIDEDAQSLTFGVMVSGKARAWVDAVSFEKISESDADAARARAAIQKIYESEGRAKFRSIRLRGSQAIVMARREDASNTYMLRETWNRKGPGWVLAESRVVTTEPVPQATSAEETRKIAADLRAKGVPLGVVEGGQMFFDVAPEGIAALGKSAGEARLVALGGGEESAALRSYLTEFLIREKGFTAVAVDVDAAALDHYVKTGQGDPRESRELEGLARWMRAFNKSRGAAVLSVAGLDGPLGVEKTVLWTRNSAARDLRERFQGIYFAGVESHRGEAPAGSGDAVLAAARAALFFLDLHSVAPDSALGHWIATPHIFSERAGNLAQEFDGLIFIEAVP